MLALASRVENGGRGEDRVLVEHFGAPTTALVAVPRGWHARES
jgi:hypothetical protein